MAKTLVTGASGFLGSHLARALADRGDDLRLLARRSSKLGHLDEVEFERTTGDVTDRRAVRRAMQGVDRVFHVAGRTSLREADRAAVFATNLRGARLVFEEALEAGVKRVVHTSSAGAIGVAKPKGAADESTPFEIGHLGNAYVNSKHEAELEAFRFAAHGLDVVIVNPTFVLGPDDPSRTSMGLVRRFCLRPDPRLRRRRAQHRRCPRRRRRPPARRREGRGRRALHPGRAQLHLRPPVRGPGPDLGSRAPGAEAAALGRARRRSVGRPDRLAAADGAGGDPLGIAVVDYRNQKARNELGFQPRPHEETLQDAVEWQLAELWRPPCRRGTPQGLAMRPSAGRCGR